MIDILRIPDDTFSDAYRKIARSLALVGEPKTAGYAGPSAQVRERLAQCVWFDQYLHADGLVTDDGRKLEVLSPGWWNVEAGPDFRNAEMRFDGRPVVRGDVEVHLEAADWARHGHHRDPAYDGVILHVVLRETDAVPPARTASGRELPQLTLARHLVRDLCELTSEFELDGRPQDSGANLGPCGHAIERARVTAEWVGRFLDLAGDERMLNKAERFAERLNAGATLEDALYEGLMESLGYKNNRRPFLRLAGWARLSDLRRLVAEDADVSTRATQLQAILMGVAGLLPTDKECARFGEATRGYVADLRRVWSPARREFGRKAMDRSAWNRAGVRPVNYPERRIAGMSYLLARHLHTGVFRAVLECFEAAAGAARESTRRNAALQNLQQLFQQEGRGYWARHYTVGGKPLARTSQLVGKQRATVMALDVVIPLLLCHARQKKDEALERALHGVYVSLRPMADNSITRYMQGRLFRRPAAAKEVVITARRQQALYQVYRDYCESHVTTCERCGLLAAMGSYEEEAT